MRIQISMLALAAGLTCSMAGGALAQGAPWPPPPGMSAGEYAARYGHLTQRPGWDRPVYRHDWERERQHRRWERERHRYYDEDDDD